MQYNRREMIRKHRIKAKKAKAKAREAEKTAKAK